jgi:hypothetical protein
MCDSSHFTTDEAVIKKFGRKEDPSYAAAPFALLFLAVAVGEWGCWSWEADAAKRLHSDIEEVKPEVN